MTGKNKFGLVLMLFSIGINALDPPPILMGISGLLFTIGMLLLFMED